MHKPALAAGTLFAALAVVLGAFGAHALKAKLTPDMLAVFETGVRYQFYHSFGLMITGICYGLLQFKNVKAVTSLFISGIALFSGSLYAIVFLSISGTSIGPAGILTPIGGLCFIIGWILLFLGLIKKGSS
jgi:uncharacterized membrane protein YgdD (TMEM256/DUF423 family)